MDSRITVLSKIVAEIIKSYEKREQLSIDDVYRIRKRYSKIYNLASVPKLVEIISMVPQSHHALLIPILKRKPIRTASGVCVVAVMCKPHRCPHLTKTGNACSYCPGGPDSDFEYSTQSYTGYEPTSMRAIRARYDPYIQVRTRIDQIKRLGHNVDKVEIIIMGGTFLSLSEEYQDWFMRSLHDAVSGGASNCVEDAVRFSEYSNSKVVAITIETRPDYCYYEHLATVLRYGATRLEIGLQSVYEDVITNVNRGHTIADVDRSFKESKDCGFKIVAHMMPNLPEVDIERDLEGFKILFEDPKFRPDGLKLYPTLVIRGTGLYDQWKKKKYHSYTHKQLVELVAKIFALVPPWVRVYRVQRDIPMPLVTSGVDYGNLREIALESLLNDLKLTTGDIRTREIGVTETHAAMKRDSEKHKRRKQRKRKRKRRQAGMPDDDEDTPEEEEEAPRDHRAGGIIDEGLGLELIRRDYYANEGWETFLSYENPSNEVLVGLLRLRKPSKDAKRRELFVKSALDASIVRELHVYGSAIPIQSRVPSQYQHKGIGKSLMAEAERIALEEHGSSKMVVIAGVGTRFYYRNLGYFSDGPYMSKNLGEK